MLVEIKSDCRGSRHRGVSQSLHYAASCSFAASRTSIFKVLVASNRCLRYFAKDRLEASGRRPMHWLASNYQWLVAVVVMPILVLLLKQWADSRKKAPTSAPPPQTTLNAQHSQVSNSPVAAGSEIKQNINAPVINVNVGQPTAPPTYGEGLRMPRSFPNIFLTGAYIASVSQVDQGFWSESYAQQDACTTTFRFLNLAPRGKKKCQPISICVTHVITRLRSFVMVR